MTSYRPTAIRVKKPVGALPPHNPMIDANAAGMGRHYYQTGFPDLLIKAEIKLPIGEHYPPHIAHKRLFNWGRGEWRVTCLVFNRFTGTTRKLSVLAQFLRTHRRCALTMSKSTEGSSV